MLFISATSLRLSAENNYYNEVDKIMVTKRKKQTNQGNKSLPEESKYAQLLLYCHRISQSDRKK